MLVLMSMIILYCTSPGAMKGKFVCKDGNPVSVFVLEDHIVTAALNKPLECCIHGNLKILHMAPDLVRKQCHAQNL